MYRQQYVPGTHDEIEAQQHVSFVYRVFHPSAKEVDWKPQLQEHPRTEVARAIQLRAESNGPHAVFLRLLPYHVMLPTTIPTNISRCTE